MFPKGTKGRKGRKTSSRFVRTGSKEWRYRRDGQPWFVFQNGVGVGKYGQSAASLDKQAVEEEDTGAISNLGCDSKE